MRHKALMATVATRCAGLGAFPQPHYENAPSKDQCQLIFRGANNMLAIYINKMVNVDGVMQVFPSVNIGTQCSTHIYLITVQDYRYIYGPSTGSEESS